MTVRSRESRVLAVLVVSMLIGAGILNALSHNPLSASAFCLSQYYHLEPVEKSVDFRAVQSPDRWEQIEIHYGNHDDSGKQAKHEVDQFPQHSNPSRRMPECDSSGCHFIIFDGYDGIDGQIKTTENWQGQFEADHITQNCPEPSGKTGRTIHICVATTGESAAPTDSQIRRTEALVAELCRRFRIERDAIKYPGS